MKKLLAISFVVFICAGITIQIDAQKKDEKVDTLKPYTTCTFDDGLTIKKTRRIKGVKNRTIETAVMFLEVTRTNSYEVLVSYPKMDIFASNRPEQSEQDAYEQDKKNVVGGLGYLLSTSRGMDSKDLLKETTGGFESHSMARSAVGTQGTLGTSVLFNDTDKTITTIYFFNAKPEKRTFENIGEWRELRDRFVSSYVACVNANSNR